MHHFCLLIGYGAGAVNPYLAFETLADMHQRRHAAANDLTLEQAKKNYIKAANKGIIKVASKMGISTVQSYRGAQIFEAVGLSKEVVDKYFTGTASRASTASALEVIAAREPGAPPPRLPADQASNGAGARQRRAVPVAPRRRVPHVEPRHRRQAAAGGAHHRLSRRSRNTPSSVNDESRHRCTIRGLLNFKKAHADPARRGRAGQGDRQAVRHRRDELRLDQQGGPREPGHRDEPHRRQEQHRRGRRRPQPLQARRQRRLAPQRHQAGRQRRGSA